ncbi:MAG: hypothetical protein U0892_03570 [Pirellulales bacterium]
MDTVEGEEMCHGGSRRPTWFGTTTDAVPAVTLAKQIIDSGQLWSHLPLSRQLPARLDDQRGCFPWQAQQHGV